jgi:16S rRNA processing protein RimM
VGEILGAYGHRGWVRVRPLTDFPERFYQLKQVILRQPHRHTAMQVLEVKPYKDAYLFHFDQIDSKETAKDYFKASVCINEDELFTLPEGYYYHFQLVGLRVYDQEQGFIGVLAEILETGANDVYVLKSERYKEILLPAIKEVVTDIDLAGQTMQVRLLPGLLPNDQLEMTDDK